MSLENLMEKCKALREKNPDKERLTYVLAELNDIEYLLSMLPQEGVDAVVEEVRGEEPESDIRPETADEVEEGMPGEGGLAGEEAESEDETGKGPELGKEESPDLFRK